MASLFKVLFLLFLICHDTVAAPLTISKIAHAEIEGDSFLNKHIGKISVFEKEYHTAVISQIPIDDFNITLPDHISSPLIPYANSKVTEINNRILKEIQDQCSFYENHAINKRNLLLAAAIAVVLGSVIYIGYVTYRHDQELAALIEDLNKYHSDESIWRKEIIQAQKLSFERQILSEKFSEFEKEALTTIQDIFKGRFNWTLYQETYVDPLIKGKTLSFQNYVDGCTSKVINVTHNIFAGDNPQEYDVYQFKSLGAIINDSIYVEPILSDKYINISGRWAVVHDEQCFKSKTCGRSAVIFPDCNPSNINPCEKKKSSVGQDFVKFYQFDNDFQFVTTLKTFTIKGHSKYTPFQSSYDVPPGGKFSVTLSRGEILEIENLRIEGPTITTTRVVFHTTYDSEYNDIAEAAIIDPLEEANAKLNEDKKIEETHIVEENKNFFGKVIEKVKSFIADYYWSLIAFGIFIFVIFLVIMFICCCIRFGYCFRF